ncbi:MAG: helix-turn-helix domain-containing protein [Solirubrobacterales bacterium]
MTAIPNFLTVPEVAAKLKLRKETVRSYIAEGELPAVRFGQSYRIDPADLEVFIDARKVTCIQRAKRVSSRRANPNETPFGKMARQVDGRGGDAAIEDVQHRKAG